jgi:hypothetical protein
MKALIDADILRYEVAFAAEAAWKHIQPGSEDAPPWELVAQQMEERIEEIVRKTGADDHELFMTEGATFRYDIAVSRPYKGGRHAPKPYHFENITVHLVHTRGATVVTYLEADDALAIKHCDDEETVLCSRDKDLRQVPGLFYAWELGQQPSFGPVDIDPFGGLDLTDKPLKLKGTGFAWFGAQVLTGDVVDTIPGLPGVGPRGAWNILREATTAEEVNSALEDAYREKAPVDVHWEDYLLEQGRLCWMTRRLHKDGKPVLWEIGMTE